MELWELDFSGVDKKLNPTVHAQGKTLCFKTVTKGFFSIELERFVSRHDLAEKRCVTTKKNNDYLDLVSITFAYEKGYGHGYDNRGLKNPFMEGTVEHDSYNIGIAEGNLSRDREET